MNENNAVFNKPAHPTKSWGAGAVESIPSLTDTAARLNARLEKANELTSRILIALGGSVPPHAPESAKAVPAGLTGLFGYAHGYTDEIMAKLEGIAHFVGVTG